VKLSVLNLRHKEYYADWNSNRGYDIMVKIRYTGARTLFLRTAGGLVHPFKPNMVYEFDETHKRFAPFVAQLRENPSMEVLDEIGTKKVGGGVRTRSKAFRAEQEKVDCPKGSYKCKGVCKCDTIKKPKGLRKSKRAD